MSGIEAVGILLGVFPLLISAAEDYKQLFKPLVEWKKFRRHFLKFIDEIGVQQAQFHLNLEALFRPIVDSEAQLHTLIYSSGTDLFHDKEVLQRLEKRLSAFKLYDACISIIEQMNDEMNDLKKLLCLGNSGINWAKDGPKRPTYQLKRVRICFSKKKYEKTNSLKDLNRQLMDLLNSNDRLVPLRTEGVTRQDAELLQTIQYHACGLYNALRYSWRCGCLQPHTTRLQLEERTVAKPRFRIVFFSANSSTESAKPKIMHETEAVELQAVSLQAPEKDPDTFPDMVSELKHHFKAKEPHKDNMQPLASAMKSSERKTSVASAGNSSLPGSTRLWQKLRKKSVQIEAPNRDGKDLHIPYRELHTGALPMPDFHDNTEQPLEDFNLAQGIESGGITSQIIRQRTTSVLDSVNTQIDDLCLAIGSQAYGFVLYEQRRFALFPMFSVSSASSITLEDLLLQENDYVLTRRDCFHLAAVLSSSLLQLSTTPWIDDKWSKRKIFFHIEKTEEGVERPIIERPYVTCEFLSYETVHSSTEARVSTSFNTRNSLRSFGVLLLELCFSRCIEKHKSRATFLGPNQRENEYTNICVAEIWQDEVSDHEPIFEDSIRRCISCYFGSMTPDWNDPKFRQAVFDYLVVPLQEVASFKKVKRQ